MKPLDTLHGSLLGLGWGRAKRFMAALSSATLIFASVGAPIALADGSSTSTPTVGSPAWFAQLSSAINFGYGNQILLLSLNLNTYNITNVTNTVTNNNTTTNNNEN